VPGDNASLVESSREESDMQWRRRSISRFIVVAFILGQLAVPTVGWAQEANSSPVASPESGSCLGDVSEGIGLDPITFQGDVVTSREETRLELFNVAPDNRAIVAGWSLLCAEDKLTKAAAEFKEGIFLDEEGQILMDVREGSVTLEENCVDTSEGCFTDGEILLGEPDGNGGFTWSNVTEGLPIVLNSPSPNVVSLTNVTVEITFGSGTTRLFASGWSVGPGTARCSTACIRFP